MATSAIDHHAAFDERVRLLLEFARLEAVDGICRVEHAMAVLDCARSTLYANRKLMAKRKKRGGRGIGFRCADVRAAQQLRGGLN
ncbi:MAG: hypothetical protein JWM95_3298 [Gemmatimonadetes bacterium]|nr:hypothetical protein [Gemmatimonadota bacterium]